MCMKMRAFLLILILSPSLSAQVLLIPTVVTSIPGGSATFSCIGHPSLGGADSIIAIQWQLNDMSLEMLGLDGVEGTFTPQLSIGLLLFSNVSQDLNMTIVTCLASLRSGSVVISDETAILLVQGRLSAVGSLAITTLSDSTLSLTWEPPFTLDITGVDPDITGYCVDVINSTSTVRLHTQCGITESSFTFPIPEDADSHMYNFTVIPVNIVGNGTENTISYIGDPCLSRPCGDFAECVREGGLGSTNYTCILDCSDLDNRSCDADDSSPNACSKVCCDHGYYSVNTTVPVETCDFVFCCFIQCNVTGYENVTEHYCNSVPVSYTDSSTTLEDISTTTTESTPAKTESTVPPMTTTSATTPTFVTAVPDPCLSNPCGDFAECVREGGLGSTNYTCILDCSDLTNRSCDADDSSPNACSKVCCDHGYYSVNTTVPVETCDFVFCCFIQCNVTGYENVTEHYCNSLPDSNSSTTIDDVSITTTESTLPPVLLEFEQSSYEVLEDVGLEDLAVRVCLIIRRIPYDISVTLVTAPGTAQEGEDYEEFTIDLRLRKTGPQRRCVGIVILEDSVAEEDETFQVVIKGLYDFTTITIRDDDGSFRYVGNSPIVRDNVVTFDLSLSGNVMEAQCALLVDNRIQIETNCSGGKVDLVVVRARNSEYTPRVRFTRRDGVETAATNTSRNLRLGVRGRCSVHLINDGISTSSTPEGGVVTTIEWGLSAPSHVIQSQVAFMCSLDGGVSFNCTSPYQTQPVNGTHSLQVSPTKTGGCSVSIARTFVF